jgi:3-isopropylmalate dehydrogenase
MKVGVFAGDGIGPEIIHGAVRVLEALRTYGHRFELEEGLIGAIAVDKEGVPLPERTFEIAKSADAVLFGATGTPANDKLPRTLRAGSSLVRLRKELNLFANYRPAKLFPELANASPLKRELVEGMDLLIIRELNGDIYYGEPRGRQVNERGEEEGVNTMRYSRSEIERIAHVAFRAARQRRKLLCSIDKANVLETMAFWREVVTEVSQQYPDVAFTTMLVDSAAMALIRRPTQFDVLLTPNLFGDILSDEASMLTGSIGMLPSASIGEGRKGLYEPIHGSAPDIAGQDKANPLATIMSVAMMLRFTFDLPDMADRIEAAVRRVLADGLRTPDIMEPGGRQVGTREMADAVAAAL